MTIREFFFSLLRKHFITEKIGSVIFLFFFYFTRELNPHTSLAPRNLSPLVFPSAHLRPPVGNLACVPGVSDAPLADLQIGVDDAGRYVILIKQIANPKP